MEIRKAGVNDLSRAMDIYSLARHFMAETGNPDQWGDEWPPENVVRKDIDAGDLYICLNEDIIVGTFFYDYGIDIEPDYDVIYNGKWISEGPYGTVHRIASDGSIKGIGSFCLGWAYGQSGHIKMDTYKDNKVMQNLLKKEGFTYRGDVMVSDFGGMMMAYEKYDM